jgi:soluble lytic murein transglycosylase-like protein
VPQGFAAWRFGELEPAAPEVVPTAWSTGWELEPPPSYRPGVLFDPVASRKALAKFADDYAKKWPELQAVSDLASVGLYDLSGPMLNDWFELWRTQVRKRDATAKRLSGTAPEAWRQLFLAARDHNNTARNLWDVWTTMTDPRQIEEAWRLAYPLAHDRYVWTHAREHNLDPYLILGLMRQESTYNATARSRVGARGAMQIMPRTGHLLADLQHDVTFDAGDLEDPTVAIGYGIRYMGLLMERFGGVYPLAVASYNGGPFNVSTWMQGTGVAMPIDELVEHIPFRETRDYVKKVTEGYSAYIALYAPQGSALGIPPIPAGDRREVVDF